MTSYETVYNRFLAKITDFELPALSEEDFDNMLYGFLVSAISKFVRCKSDLSLRDDENQQFSATLADIEIEILSLLMVAAWLEPQVNSVLVTKQMFGGKEEKFYAQSKHSEELRALYERSKLEALKLSRDRTYVNSSYFD